MNRIAIIGGGGHARVLAEIVLQSNDLVLIGCFDDATDRGVELWDGVVSLGPLRTIGKTPDRIDGYVLGIGNNLFRKKITEDNPHLSWISLIHPSAVISPSAHIGSGSVVLAGAVIATNARIGNQVIVNANVVVDHDCHIQNFVHLSIGSLVGSNSVVEETCLIQVGQIIPSFSKVEA
jgi:acetyltransferase EpsM